MNPQSWVAQNLGKGDPSAKPPTYLTPRPSHGINGQCVNAASSWSLSIGGPELMGATAYAIWQDFRHPFYQVINTASVLPGDIVFFAPNNYSIGTGPAGHVAVAVNGGLGTVDADWGSYALKLVNHTTNGVLGVFRHPQEVDMPSLTTQGDADEIKVALIGQHLLPEDQHWVGIPWPQAFNEMYDSPGAAAFRALLAKDQTDAMAYRTEHGEPTGS